MRKLRLDPDAVRVETFHPRPPDDVAAGTVLARAATLDPRSCGGTCYFTQLCGCGGPTAVDPTCEGEPQCG